MAYRKLYHGDLVRIVDITNGYHGCDAVVIDAQEHFARVQINVGRTDRLESRCIDVPNRNLLVRHSEYHFIVDGRIDHDAKHKYEQIRHTEYNKRNMVDSEPECPYAYLDRDELIEKIKELERVIERVIEEHEEPLLK